MATNAREDDVNRSNGNGGSEPVNLELNGGRGQNVDMDEDLPIPIPRQEYILRQERIKEEHNAGMMELDEELAEIALRELNEDPATRIQKLAELRELVEKDEQLHCPTDDRFLLKFLRHRKFNVLEAHQRIRKNYITRAMNPDVFRFGSPRCCWETMQSGVISVLPDKDKFSRRVVIYRPALWNYQKSTRETLLLTSAVILERLLMDEEVQIRGITVVIDLAHLSAGTAMKLGPGFSKKFNAVTQKAVPMRVKNIQMLRGGKVFNVLYKMASVFMTDKMKSRVQNCGSDPTKLALNICPEESGADMLPTGDDYKGTGSVKLPSEDFYIDVLAYTDIFEENQRYHIDSSAWSKGKR